jgi:ribosome assembly protein YihI (activator of Der GTPase)
MMPERLENGQKLVEEVQKYKDWNLAVFYWLMRALLIKKIQFEEEKFKIRCLWTHLNFIEV